MMKRSFSMQKLFASLTLLLAALLPACNAADASASPRAESSAATVSDSTSHPIVAPLNHTRLMSEDRTREFAQ